MAASTTVLTDDQLRPLLAALQRWERSADGTSLSRAAEFADFSAAFAFVTAVALHAQRVNHHPDFAVSWATVTFTLTTHSAGGITSGDTDLAATIDALAAAHGERAAS